MVQCPPLPAVNGTQLAITGISPGDVAFYACAEGLTLLGNTTRECGMDGQWTNLEPPSCAGITKEQGEDWQGVQ